MGGGSGSGCWIKWSASLWYLNNSSLVRPSVKPSFGPLPLKEHLQCNKCILVHKVIHNKSPQYLRQLVRTGARNDHSSRNSILILPKTRIDIYKMSFAYSGSFCWNALPRSLKVACSVSTFKSKALQHFRTECNT